MPAISLVKVAVELTVEHCLCTVGAKWSLHPAPNAQRVSVPEDAALVMTMPVPRFVVPVASRSRRTFGQDCVESTAPCPAVIESPMHSIRNRPDPALAFPIAARVLRRWRDPRL